MTEKKKLLGAKHSVDTKDEAIITLEFVRKHLDDLKHGAMADELRKVRGFIVHHLKDK